MTIDRSKLRQLAERAGFSKIYTQGYSGCFEDIKAYKFLNGENYLQKSSISRFNFFIHKIGFLRIALLQSRKNKKF